MDRITRIVQNIRALPVVRTIDRRRYDRVFARHTSAVLFRGVYRSFAEAEADLPATKPHGCDNAPAATMYGGVEQPARLIDYPAIHWLGELVGPSRNLLDYGGHVGVRYYCYSKYLHFPPDFTWRVWDTPAAMAQGRKIAAENGIEGLTFVDDLTDPGPIDLFFASGSLQFFEEALPDTLERIGLRPRHILINGFPLHEKHEFVTVVNQGSSFCTYQVYRKNSFLERMRSAGYELLDEWQDSPAKRCHIPHHDEYNGTVYHGFVFRAVDS